MSNAGDAKWRILNAAVIAARRGLPNVKLRVVARAAGVDHKAVAYHFGNVEKLRLAAAQEGIARGDAAVMARLILDDHDLVRGLSNAARREVLDHC
jgi:AcrR family transcriptional regulator